MKESSRNQGPLGLLFYVAFTCSVSWAMAWLLSTTWLGEGRPLVTRLLTCSAFYAVTMGWQPILAVLIARRRVEAVEPLEVGFRSASGGYFLLACAVPCLLSIAAALCAYVLEGFEPHGAMSIHASAEGDLMAHEPSAVHAVALALALAATVLLVWVQSLGEEAGWRGYFLTRMMQRFGAWKGLLLHGVVWGIWYAPVFVMANADLFESLFRSASFLVTCCLLGVLLGWLRLASRSVVPSAVANWMLTVMAGLPFLLRGVEVGARGAVYGPPGWIPMLAVIVMLALGRTRYLVTVPRVPRSGLAPYMEDAVPDAGRTLH